MNMPILLTVTTSGGVLVNTHVESVSLPGSEGAFTVLNSHAPLVASLTAGDIVYAVGGETRSQKIERGFVRVLNNKVEACVEL
ncbi:MAG: hypothetical protein K6F20_07905 [Bacteroidaceae bacterium]|nr:hypothetical protein [Bacteroidaceae bacterium]